MVSLGRLWATIGFGVIVIICHVEHSRNIHLNKRETQGDSSHTFGMTSTVILSGAYAQSKNLNEQCVNPMGPLDTLEATG